MELSKEYWNNRYQQMDTGWDVGKPSTPLAEYINQLENKNLRVLIPGCGNAHEAMHLVQNGFTDITLIDIAPELTAKLTAEFTAYPQVKIFTGDFFELQGEFDLVIEQTFFCALDRNLRQKYYQKMSEILTAKGKIAGVMFASEFTKEGPPFGGTKEEYRPLIEKHFAIKTLEPCYNSIAKRQGNELFVILQKK